MDCKGRSQIVDEERIKSAVAAILEATGEDPLREGLRGTPGRVARMYAELFSGIGVDPRSALDTIFEEEGHQEGVVIVRDVPFFAMCEHHLLPFFGKVHIGYIPRGRIVGISKLARASDILARRPQVQERLTSQLADALMAALDPSGVAVVIEAEHMCMTMRGVRKPGSQVITSAVRGQFRDAAVTRQEFLALVHGRSH